MNTTKLTVAAILISLIQVGAWAEDSDVSPQGGPRPESSTRGTKSRDLVQERIAKEFVEAQKVSRAVPDALVAVQEVQSAVQALGTKNAPVAKVALTRALGKADALLAQYPDMSLIPFSVTVRVFDLISDEQSVKAISNQAKQFVVRNDFQKARATLRNFASEINVLTQNIPMASYPPAIRQALRDINENQLANARTGLLEALNSIVSVERAIPLPVVKAQVMVEEVSRQVADRTVNRLEATNLLDQAQQQLRIAEAMGYGTRRQDFAGIQKSLQELRNNIDHSDNRGILSRIVDDLKNLKR